MCSGVHYGKVERVVSLQRCSCSRNATCVMDMAWLPNWSVHRGGLITEVIHVWWNTLLGLKFRDGLFWEVVLYQRCFLCGEYIMGRLRHWSL